MSGAVHKRLDYFPIFYAWNRAALYRHRIWVLRKKMGKNGGKNLKKITGINYLKQKLAN